MKRLKKDGSLWDSDAEKYVFQCLCKIINKEHFYIFPHLLVKEVFKEYWNYEDFKKNFHEYSKFCDADSEKTHFELLHFDFTIFNSEYFPVLIIEVDGPFHSYNTRNTSGLIDGYKEQIIRQNRIKLLRLELYETINALNEQSKTENIMKKLETQLKALDLDNPYNYPKYCKYGHRMLYQPKSPSCPFFYCPECKDETTGKNKTLSKTEEACPPIFLFDSISNAEIN